MSAAEVPWQGVPEILDVEALLHAGRPAWHDEANCRGLTHVMFPRKRVGIPSSVMWAEAFAVCAACTVITQCRKQGQGEAWGVWGGDTNQQRRFGTTRTARNDDTRREP